MANVLLVAVALFFGAALAFSVRHHEDYFGGAVRNALYYVLPLAGGLGSLLCLRLSRDNRLIVATSAVAALIVLYAPEIYLSGGVQVSNPFPANREQRTSSEMLAAAKSAGGDPAVDLQDPVPRAPGVGRNIGIAIPLLQGTRPLDQLLYRPTRLRQRPQIVGWNAGRGGDLG